MGFCYSIFLVRFSNLMLYFLIQTVASFSIFIFYLLSSPFFLLLSLFIKLSMFPFHSWFFSVVYRFPNSALFVSSTFHKLPPFMLVSFFLPFSNISLVMACCIFTVLLSGRVMLFSSDFRLLLVASSVGNNSWFYLSSLFSFTLFFFFILFYSFVLFLAFSFIGQITSVKVSSSPSLTLFCTISLFLSGLPPSPLFPFKLIVIYCSLLSAPSELVFLFLLSSVLLLVSYLRILMSYLTLSYTFSMVFK